MPSTSQTCIRMHYRTSLVPTVVLYSYSLLVCHLHCRPAFACIAKPLCHPLMSYIRTHCSYAVNIADLHSCVAEPHCYLLRSYIRMCCSHAINIVDWGSHLFQSLAGVYCYSTFTSAAHLPRLLLTNPYVLFICHLHSRPAFTFRASLVTTAILHSYAWLVCHQHSRPAWIRVADLCHYIQLSYTSTCCMSATFAAGYIHMHFSSAIYIVDLCSYVLQSFAATHSCPTFVHAACLPSISSI